MKFAYSLELTGEFLAIDDSGRVAARTPIRGAVPLDPDGLTQMTDGILAAQARFCEQNHIAGLVAPTDEVMK